MTETDTVTAAYFDWIKEILETHADRKWDVAEDESADEELNKKWDLLPVQLRRRLWGLSADLFSLVDDERFSDQDWSPISKEELATLLEKAFRNRQWDELLELLRRPPRFTPGDQVSYIRGRAWQELGQPELALRFFDNASRLKPEHDTYRIVSLDCLKAMGEWQEAVNRAEQYSRDPASSPALLFRAADIYHSFSMTYAGNQQELAERAIEIVNQGFDALGEDGVEKPLESIMLAAHFTKASCLERLDRTDDALSIYDDAIRSFPKNAELFTARGLLRLDRDPEAAIEDLRNAVAQGANTVWPYLEVAIHDFDAGCYGDLLELCRAGLAKADRDAVAAQLFNLLALALLASKDSVAAVDSAFKAAMSLDPFNLAIKNNFERFSAVSRDPEEFARAGWELSRVPIEEVRRFHYQSVQPPRAA